MIATYTTTAADSPAQQADGSIASNLARSVGPAFGAHRAPVTEAAPTFAPAASAPVTRSACVARRSNPLCALEKNKANIESVSTTERIMSESFPMRSLNQSFWTDSLHSSSASSTRIPAIFPNGFRSEVTANNALQRTATGCHGSCYSRSGVFPSSHLLTSSGAPSAFHVRSYRASPPRSLSFGSLGR